MAGIEADTEPFVAPDSVHDQHELVERASDRSAGAGRVLDQGPRPFVAALEHLLDRRHRPVEADVETGAEMRADVEDDPIRLDRTGCVDGRPHRLDALRVDRVVRSGKVDEVESVDEDAEARFLALRSEGLEVGRVVGRETPGPWALREQLARLGAHRDPVAERLLDPSRAVGSEQHLSNLTACPSASAWLRAQPASSTSGTSEPRSSTGSSPVTRAASSVFASRTRIRAARSTRRR